MIISNALRRGSLFFAIAIFSATFSQDAMADWYLCSNGKKLRWPSTSATLRFSSVSFVKDGSAHQAVKDAAIKWNSTGSAFDFSTSWGDTSVSTENDESEIWGTDDEDYLDGALAVTQLWFNPNTCQLTSADVVLDYTSPWIWNTGTYKSEQDDYCGSSFSMRGTAVHELGHACGSDHTAHTASMMGYGLDYVHANGDQIRYCASEYDIAESIKVYGKDPVIHDLSVLHWKRTGASGEYAVNGRTRIVDAASKELTKAGSACEPKYYVTLGESVRLEATFETKGTSTLTHGVNYYLSTNDVIATSDILLATETLTSAVDKPLTRLCPSIKVPATLTPGKSYWLGIIVDPNDAVDEVLETNNATYIAEIVPRIPDHQAMAIAGPTKLKLENGQTAASITFDTNVSNYLGTTGYQVFLERVGAAGESYFVAGGTFVGSAPQTVNVTVDVPKGKYRWKLVAVALPGETVISNNIKYGNTVKIKGKKS